MSETVDSIYPDFLRSGLGKLNQQGSPHELLSLFTALEHFRRDLHAQQSAIGILQVSRCYIEGLNLFGPAGFYLINPADHGFELALCAPEAERARLEQAVRKEIQAGRFAWALRQTSPVRFQAGPPTAPERGLLHTLALSNQVLGMFCGLLRHELDPAHEIASSLLSMLLGACTDALATLHKTAELTSQIKTLRGLLPICAWCRKVRDDQGYWAQIEKFVQSRTDAAFSHCICPDCEKKFLESDPDNG